MAEIRIEKKSKPWWLLILLLLIVVAVVAWLYYDGRIGVPERVAPAAVGEVVAPQPAARLLVG